MQWNYFKSSEVFVVSVVLCNYFLNAIVDAIIFWIHVSEEEMMLDALATEYLHLLGTGSSQAANFQVDSDFFPSGLRLKQTGVKKYRRKSRYRNNTFWVSKRIETGLPKIGFPCKSSSNLHSFCVSDEGQLLLLNHSAIPRALLDFE